MSATGKKRLLALADFLETVPKRRFKMEIFADEETLSLNPECKTSACALGWATVRFPQHLALKTGQDGLLDVVGRKSGTWNFGAAAWFFDLDVQAAMILFGGDKEATPKQKAKEIRDFLKAIP